MPVLSGRIEGMVMARAYHILKINTSQFGTVVGILHDIRIVLQQLEDAARYKQPIDRAIGIDGPNWSINYMTGPRRIVILCNDADNLPILAQALELLPNPGCFITEVAEEGNQVTILLLNKPEDWAPRRW